MTRKNFIKNCIVATVGSNILPSFADMKVKFDDVKNKLYSNISDIIRKYTYEQNTKETRRQLETEVLECLYSFMHKYDIDLIENKVICDESNNTSATIDRNEFHLDVAFKTDGNQEFRVVSWFTAPTSMQYINCEHVLV